MWIAKMDTEHFSWIAAGATQDAAREALAHGFLLHLTQLDGADALLRFGLYVGSDEAVPREELAEVLDDWYGVTASEIAAGTCLRDMSPVSQ